MESDRASSSSPQQTNGQNSATPPPKKAFQGFRNFPNFIFLNFLLTELPDAFFFFFFQSLSTLCPSLQVDAYPPVVSFVWFFNNSDHRVDRLDETRFDADGLESTLDFTPGSAQDYGTLYCSGENAIGRQREPCKFQIVPTGELIKRLATLKAALPTGTCTPWHILITAKRKGGLYLVLGISRIRSKTFVT